MLLLFSGIGFPFSEALNISFQLRIESPDDRLYTVCKNII